MPFVDKNGVDISLLPQVEDTPSNFTFAPFRFKNFSLPPLTLQDSSILLALILGER
uniref:Uncharacterized protein n=1 Tax=Candidatus Kentrum sp. FM TaxID=2126340 RepID=A0A450W2R1_9GAMM|nr:MAG: hypothetical protein BECKFM1743A_GA0114220_1004812 [Candidatus Kentron sp. FM]VFJ49231.1 MAG: hypothetical protein BECKFM1743C_GA0114222_1006810 [Candidatus Kentron sp. FM]VFK11350.1 MAG: hypothetical protein BECKFM1743B_GA0114221_101772 [Candidatus Kentron sp. FM]